MDINTTLVVLVFILFTVIVLAAVAIFSQLLKAQANHEVRRTTELQLFFQQLRPMETDLSEIEALEHLFYDETIPEEAVQEEAVQEEVIQEEAVLEFVDQPKKDDLPPVFLTEDNLDILEQVIKDLELRSSRPAYISQDFCNHQHRPRH